MDGGSTGLQLSKNAALPEPGFRREARAKAQIDGALFGTAEAVPFHLLAPSFRRRPPEFYLSITSGRGVEFCPS
jgi:hypothetical protein